jgi:hypothetical protein
VSHKGLFFFIWRRSWRWKVDCEWTTRLKNTDFSHCRLKTQKTQKAKLYLKSWSSTRLKKKWFFLFDTVRIWEFSPMWTDFDKCDNLSKRNVKLILKILSDLEPLRGSSNKITLYSTRSCVNWTFFGIRGPLKRSFHSRLIISIFQLWRHHQFFLNDNPHFFLHFLIDLSTT